MHLSEQLIWTNLCDLLSSHSLISGQTTFTLFWTNHSQTVSEDLHESLVYEPVFWVQSKES